MGQNCLPSASDSSMLLATRSFLSALSFCFKISMLVSPTLGSAAVWSAKADPARSMAPVRKHGISLYIGHVLSDVGEVSDAVKKRNRMPSGGRSASVQASVTLSQNNIRYPWSIVYRD